MKRALERWVPLREQLRQVNAGLSVFWTLALAQSHAMDEAMQRVPLTLFAAIIALQLVACTDGSGRYPTLEIRPGERVARSSVPAEGDSSLRSPPAPSAQLVQHLAQLQGQASTAHAGFLSAVPLSRELADAAGRAEVGSDAWASAQVALADLDSARSLSAIALGDLDILYLDARLTGGARQEIDESRNAVLTILEEEDRVLAELRAEVR